MNLDMKKIVMILFALMLISFSIAGFLGASFGPWNGTFISDSVEQIDATHVFANEEVHEILIDSISTDVNIISVKEDEVKVHLYGEATEGMIPIDFARQNGNRISIDIRPQQQHLINFSSNAFRLTLDVYVPEEYTERLRVHTVSGDLLASGLSLDTLTFNSVSGKLHATAFHADLANLNTTSGDMEINGFAGDITAKTVSGNVRVEYKEFMNNINVSTTSGDTLLKLPEHAEFRVQLETVSGRVNTEFPMLIESQSSNRNFVGTVGSADNSIRVKSVSGNVNINQ